MPAGVGRTIRSQAQWRALHAIAARGGISRAKLKEMIRYSPPFRSLPKYRPGSRSRGRRGRRFCIRWGRSARARRSVCREYAWYGGRSRRAISRQVLRTKRRRYGRSLRSR